MKNKNVDVTCNDCGSLFSMTLKSARKKKKENSIFRCPACTAKYLSKINKERLMNRSEEEKLNTNRKMSEAASVRNKKYWANLSEDDRKRRSEKQSENNRKRWAEMDESQRKEVGNNISKGQKLFWQNASDEFREDFGEKQSRAKKEWWNNLSDDKLEDMLVKRSASNKFNWENKSNEEKELFSLQQKERWENKSDEEKAAISEFHRQRWANMSEDDKNELLTKLNAGAEEWRNNLTDEDREQLSIAGKERWENMSDEQKSQIALSKKLKWEALSDEEKEAVSIRERERWANMSPEEKMRTSLRGKQLWNNLSDEEKQAISDRERQRWANLPDTEKEIWVKYGKDLSDKRKIWWSNLPDNEKELMKIQSGSWYDKLSDKEKEEYARYHQDYWNNLPTHSKEYYIHKSLTGSNGRNKFHQKFEKTFYEIIKNYELYYIAEHPSSNTNLHSWDYGIFDYGDNLVCLVDLDGAYFHADDKHDYDGIHSKYEYDIKRGQSIYNEMMHCIIREEHFDEDFQWLLHILPLTYDEFIEEELHYLTAMPFPHQSYTDDELVYSWTKLSNMKVDDKYHQNMKTKSHLGDHIVYHFCHSLYDESVWDEEWVRNALKTHMIYHPHMNKNKLLMCVPHEEFTPPGQARIMLKDYSGEFIDPNCDVGMMLGCIASHIQYRSICTNLARYNEIERMLQWLTDHGIKYDINISLDQRLVI